MCRVKTLGKIMRLTICMVIGIAVAGLSGSSGQTASTPGAPNRPVFEVASIKLSNPTAGMVGVFTYPGGGVFFGHMTLQFLVCVALRLQDYQVSGGPAWSRETQYDIETRVPAASESAKLNAPRFRDPMNAEQREMLLSLLADRFQLKFHNENNEGPVYFLLKGDKALKLIEPASKDAYPSVGSAGKISGTGIRAENASMPLLAERLCYYLGRPVIDQTGIKGSFDFEYLYDPDDAHPDVVSTTITSVEEIGLKLKSGKAPVQRVVIEQAEKPSPN
jgi:uncharacterized protein (TIGR03435 family)